MLKGVVNWFCMTGLNLKPSNHSVFQREAPSLGYVVNAQGVSTDANKVVAVLESVQSSNLLEVKALSTFFKDSVTLAKLFSRLMAKGKENI